MGAAGHPLCIYALRCFPLETKQLLLRKVDAQRLDAEMDDCNDLQFNIIVEVPKAREKFSRYSPLVAAKALYSGRKVIFCSGRSAYGRSEKSSALPHSGYEARKRCRLLKLPVAPLFTSTG